MSEFVHLHLHSHYSVLDGVSQIPEVFAKAHACGQRAVALTDHGNMFGIMEFYHASQNKSSSGKPIVDGELNVKPIFGAELYLDPISRFRSRDKTRTKPYHLVLLARNMQGYRNLMKLSTLGYLEGFHYKPRIDHQLLQEYSEGLIATSACLSGELSRLILEEKEEQLQQALDFYIETFGKEHFYLEIQDHGLPEQKIVAQRMLELSRRTGLGVVATNDVHYLNQEDARLQEIMFATREKTTLSDPSRYRYDSDQFYFKTNEEMAALFSGIPEALSNTLRIADMIDLEMKFDMHLPQYRLPQGETPPTYLDKLCRQGLSEKFQGEMPGEYLQRLERELAMIEQMGFSNYFLVVYDFVNYARRKGILVGPGRGSAAGAMVAYSLGITNVDPIRYSLLFERFLNPERVSMPDIDIDFQDDRRDEVKEYIRSHYGYDRTADVITFGVSKSRASLTDVGRALEIPLDYVKRITKLIDNRMANESLSKLIEMVPELKEIRDRGSETDREWLEYSCRIDGTIRNLGTHASALIISQDDLSQVIPLYFDSRNQVVTTQYDGHYLEENGLLKMDILGLSTLTLIQDCLLRIQKNHHLRIDMDSIPMDDQAVYELLSRGETEGVFQFESEGMTAYLRQLQPNCIDDLIAMNALYRPGPMDNIPNYILRKQGREDVDYFHPRLEWILKPTYGVIVYQEQVMQIAQELAGFSLGKADILRRAMAKKNKQLDTMRPEWVEGAVSLGFEKDLAEKIFDLLIPFSNYAFNKSHSAAYSIVAYQTAWLKTWYYQEFTAALLTLNLGDSDAVRKYILAARARGLNILPPDINASGWDFHTEGSAVRFGLGAIKGLGEGFTDTLVQERERGGPFSSFEDFVSRMLRHEDFKKTGVEVLLKAGGFDSLYSNESRLLEKAVLLHNLDGYIEHASQSRKEKARGQLSLFGENGQDDFSHHINRSVPPLSLEDEFRHEVSVFGFYLSGRVYQHYQSQYGDICRYNHSLLPLLPSGTPVLVWGFVSGLLIKNAESKRAWASFSVDTPQETLRLVVLSDKYDRFRTRLREDAFVLIKLVTSQSEKGPRYEVADIQDIQAIRSLKFTELHIVIDPGQNAAGLSTHLEALRDLAVQEQGSQYKLIFHTLQDGRYLTIQGSDRYRVKLSHSLLTALESMPPVTSWWVY